MQILHACYGGQGGEASVIQELAKGLQERGVRNAVLAFGPEDVLIPEAAWGEASDATLIPIAKRMDLRSMVSAIVHVRRVRPAVIFCHTHRHAPALFLGMLLAGVRPVLINVEHPALALRSLKVNLSSLLSLCFSSATVVLSEEYRLKYPLRRFPLRAAKRIYVIPNGVSITATAGVNAADPNRLHVGMAARLAPEKDQASLIRGFEYLVRENPSWDVRLFIAGVGPCRRSLVELTHELGIANRVDFVGHLSAEEMTAFYRNLDVYAHIVSVENVSMSLLEATAAGVPVVASDVAGVRDFIKSGVNGILVASNTPEDVSRGIVEAQVKRHTLAPKALEIVGRFYSRESMVNAYLDLMSRVTLRGAR